MNEPEDPPAPPPEAFPAPAEPDAAPATAPEAKPAQAAAPGPVYREARGYRLRLDPPDLVRLRDLPGSRGKSDEDLGTEFLAGLSDRFTTALEEDVPAPAEIRVVVDPWSRQAFLALERRIRAILSF